MHNTLLFVSPKRGGILQSSGFLDLQSLMALSKTCKAHELDELSLILLLENEVTLHHQVKTVPEALAFWRKLYCYPLLKQWLLRDTAISGTAAATPDMISTGIRFEVMIGKMICTIPQSDRLTVVNTRDAFERTVLHGAASSGNLESLKTLLALYPQAEICHVVSSMKDRSHRTVLHCAAVSGNPESIKFILMLLSEEQRIRAVCGLLDLNKRTVLHCTTTLGDRDSTRVILSLLPEAQHLHAVMMQDMDGQTALHYAVNNGRSSESICSILALLPESQRSQAICVQDRNGYTVLHLVAHTGKFDSIVHIQSLLPESDRTQAVSIRDRRGNTVMDLLPKSTPSLK